MREPLTAILWPVIFMIGAFRTACLILKRYDRNAEKDRAELKRRLKAAQDVAADLKKGAAAEQVPAEEPEPPCPCVICSHRRLLAEIEQSAVPNGAKDKPQVIFAKGGAWVLAYAPGVALPRSQAEFARVLDDVAAAASRASLSLQPRGAGGEVH